MNNWQLGTVGFGYKDWDGCFYPTKTPQREYLQHYSKIFNSVEIDSSFYACPTSSSLNRWYKESPEAFKFCFKAPRYISHDMHLLGVEKEMFAFVEALALMKDKLGVVLIQMPPSFSADKYINLVNFLDHLNQEIRPRVEDHSGLKLNFALEFRHESWYSERTTELLARHNVAWVGLDYLHYPKQLTVSSDFLYLRFIGKHGKYAVKDKVREDRRERLQWWYEEINKTLKQAPNIKNIYGYFNNDYSGHSPATCKEMKEIIGLETPQVQTFEQTSLF